MGYIQPCHLESPGEGVQAYIDEEISESLE